MIIHSNIVIRDLIIHKINEAGPEFSINPIDGIHEMLSDVLINYFFKPFKDSQKFALHHPVALERNDVFDVVSTIFDDPDKFTEYSQRLAEHLHSVSSHHNIKEGDLFIAHFEDCVLDDEIVNAIGLFKAENKDTFLKVYPEGNSSYNINASEGININKLDKGAIIFNTDKQTGYTVLVTDTVNKENARYWLDEFLRATPVENDFYQTQSIINLCQDFVQEIIPDEDKTDRIALMNDSISYLKSTDSFNNEEFKDRVLQEPELKEAFDDFRDKAIEEQKISPDEEFDISRQAIKKTKRYIRSVIKLDKNFHVYVHGNREHIRKGFDEGKNKNFYTLYFDEET